MGISSEHWEKQKEIFQKAFDKITKNPSLEVIELRKNLTY